MTQEPIDLSYESQEYEEHPDTNQDTAMTDASGNGGSIVTVATTTTTGNREETGEPYGPEDEDDEGQIGPSPVEALIGNGISKKDVEKLQEAGLCTVESIAYTPKRFLQRSRGYQIKRQIS